MIFIGLSGTIAAGKGEVLRIIREKYNVRYFSLSDELREVLRKLGKEINRDNLISIGNKLRKENGSGYIARRLIEKIKEMRGKGESPEIVILDSIRNPKEVDEFRNEFGDKFYLFFIDAPRRMRYERARKRKREGEGDISFEEFVRQDDEGLGKDQPEWGNNLSKCREKADFMITNDGSLEDLKRKVLEIVKSIVGK